MRCIFCKGDSTSSKAIEHVVPESLGNIEHVLPQSVVCDKCNNYFARKIEKPFLESPAIAYLRSRQEIANKRGFIPPISALSRETGVEVNIDNQYSVVYPTKESEADKFLKMLISRNKGTLLVPVHPAKPDTCLTARFLGKVAIEALVYRFIQASLSYEEVIDSKELDPLRNFVRYGNTSNQLWEYNERVIYMENKIFRDGEHYQVLHEFTFLQTDENETIFIFALFGTEHAISLDRKIKRGYLDWLVKNNEKSPLYP